MTKIKKTGFLGTTKKLDSIKTGCLFTFYYRAKGVTDTNPLIIMTKPKWTAKKGGSYISGVNLNFLTTEARDEIISEYGNLPIGSVSYQDLKDSSEQDPECCIRTYNTRKVQALHKVEADSLILPPPE